jgi:hypothetical protein
MQGMIINVVSQPMPGNTSNSERDGFNLGCQLERIQTQSRHLNCATTKANSFTCRV